MLLRTPNKIFGGAPLHTTYHAKNQCLCRKPGLATSDTFISNAFY